MRHSERTIACLTHLSGLIPIWGALFMGVVNWRYRERSRPVVFHSQQALLFHLTILACFTVPILLFGAGRLIGAVRPDPGLLIQGLAKWIATIVFAANALMAFWAANDTIEGRIFEYPIWGRRLRGQFEHD